MSHFSSSKAPYGKYAVHWRLSSASATEERRKASPTNGSKRPESLPLFLATSIVEICFSCPRAIHPIKPTRTSSRTSQPPKLVSRRARSTSIQSLWVCHLLHWATKTCAGLEEEVCGQLNGRYSAVAGLDLEIRRAERKYLGRQAASKSSSADWSPVPKLTPGLTFRPARTDHSAGIRQFN